jgi:hypothetical protein
LTFARAKGPRDSRLLGVSARWLAGMIDRDRARVLFAGAIERELA